MRWPSASSSRTAGSPAACTRSPCLSCRPEAVNAARGLAKAEQELTGQAGTPAGDAQRTASLLTAALAHYADHPGALCPVCAGRPLDEPWAADARREISRLAVIAREADAAVSERDGAAQALRTVLPSEPLVLSQDSASRSTRPPRGQPGSGGRS